MRSEPHKTENKKLLGPVVTSRLLRQKLSHTAFVPPGATTPEGSPAVEAKETCECGKEDCCESPT